VDALRRSILIGPKHSFPLGEQPALLSETLALDKAREVLALEGFDPTLWQPCEDARTFAPDGTADRCFLRSDPERVDLEGAKARGAIMFRRTTDGLRRTVCIELWDHEIVGWLVIRI
jgi:hypothetical protein